MKTTIEEARKLKYELQEKFDKLISDFEDTTGLSVNSIERWMDREPATSCKYLGIIPGLPFMRTKIKVIATHEELL